MSPELVIVAAPGLEFTGGHVIVVLLSLTSLILGASRHGSQFNSYLAHVHRLENYIVNKGSVHSVLILKNVCILSLNSSAENTQLMSRIPSAS
jgi:hypothetical protein